MEINKEIDLLDCPLCGGGALVEEENGWCCYVTCMDCGAHTAEVSYSPDVPKEDAIKKAAHLWNIGKVLSCNPGE